MTTPMRDTEVYPNRARRTAWALAAVIAIGMLGLVGLGWQLLADRDANLRAVQAELRAVEARSEQLDRIEELAEKIEGLVTTQQEILSGVFDQTLCLVATIRAEPGGSGQRDDSALLERLCPDVAELDGEGNER